MKEAENSERFSYDPVQSNSHLVDEHDHENFSDVNQTPKRVISSQIFDIPHSTVNEVLEEEKTMFILFDSLISLNDCF